MSRVQEPFKMRKHSALQDEINEVIIGIKLHHIGVVENNEAINKAKSNHPAPTWDQIIELLHRANKALDEQRYDPRKY